MTKTISRTAGVAAKKPAAKTVASAVKKSAAASRGRVDVQPTHVPLSIAAYAAKVSSTPARARAFLKRIGAPL